MIKLLSLFSFFLFSTSTYADCKKSLGERFTIPGKLIQVAGNENSRNSYELKQDQSLKEEYIFSIVEKKDTGRWLYYVVKVEKMSKGKRVKTLKGHYRLSCSIVDPVAESPKNESKKTQIVRTVIRSVDGLGQDLTGLNNSNIEILEIESCPVINEQDRVAPRAIGAFYSDTAIDMIKDYEKFKPEMYTCSGGACTVGYGHKVHCSPTGCDKEAESPFRFNSGAVRPISEKEALKLLEDDMNQKAMAPIKRLVKPEMLSKLNQNQRDALISFVFNVGGGNFAKSTLLKRLNAGRFSEVPTEMKKWNKAGGQVRRGLVRRRKSEADLFVL
jgi:GH24 family phage-related lysozyme (muramidase)